MTQWSALSHPWAAASFSKRNQPVPPFSPHPSLQNLCGPVLSSLSPRAFPFLPPPKAISPNPRRVRSIQVLCQHAKWVRLKPSSFQKAFVNDQAQATKHVPRLNACENQTPLVTAQDRQTAEDAPSEQQHGRGTAGAVPGRTAASQSRRDPAQAARPRSGLDSGSERPRRCGNVRATALGRRVRGRARKKHPTPGASTSLEQGDGWRRRDAPARNARDAPAQAQPAARPLAVRSRRAGAAPLPAPPARLQPGPGSAAVPLGRGGSAAPGPPLAAVPRPGLCRGRAWARRAHPLCPALRSPGSGANTRAHRR